MKGERYTWWDMLVAAERAGLVEIDRRTNPPRARVTKAGRRCYDNLPMATKGLCALQLAEDAQLNAQMHALEQAITS